MLMFGKKTCGLCGSQGPKKQGLRAPDRQDGFVCRPCVDEWERSGRRCAECQTSVAGMQDIGAFFERRMLGHADCGGVRLFA